MSEDCIFCDESVKRDVILDNDIFYSIWDENPVSEGHALIVPKKHIESFFDLTSEELLQMYDIIKRTKEVIDEKYHPGAYNIGVNDGEAAGRTIHHLHVHLIPRYKGDVENPRGGVRSVIPGKGDY